MIRYEEALNFLRSSAMRLGSEEVPFFTSLYRVCAESVLSPENLPAFGNSAMDGFALRAQEIAALNRFHVKGLIAAGDWVPNTPTTRNECWEIMTGAAVPPDCDAGIKVEDVKRHSTEIVCQRLIKEGENIRPAGTDFQKGATVLEKGTRILPDHLMAFAALGIQKIPVVRKPNISVVSTGAELNEAPSRVGQIRNSTAPYLLAELARLGATPKFLGTLSDEPREFIKRIRAELEAETDVIVSTGAVSMGKYDFVATALRDLGAEILFHKVAIRPGKPLLFARMGKTAFFGVPGNPISTVVALRFFLEPYLRDLQGVNPEQPLRARLVNTWKKPEGLRCFFKATSTPTQCEILKGQESYRIRPLLAANSWAVLPEEGTEVSEGTEIDVFPLHS